MKRAARSVSSLLALPLALGFASLARPAAAQDAAPAPAAPAAPAKPPAKPFLWVVEGTPRIYLFGTIHLPDDRVKDLPPATKAAIAASDVVWGELSMEDLNSPAAAGAMMLPAGKSLGDVMPKETVDRLHAYLTARGSPEAMFDRMKPMWASVFVGLLDALPLLMSRVPMDKQILMDAKEAKKETGGLETLKEQLDVFDTVSDATASKFMDETLKDLEQAKDGAKKPLDLLLDGYVSGDLDEVLKEMDKVAQSADAEVKALAKRLLQDRNVVMVDRLLERAQAAPDKTYFVAVGAAHYAGPEGIVALLEKKGKKLRRLAADEKLPAPTKAPEVAPAGK